MKKVLRFLLVIIGVVIAGVLITGLIAPKDISMERSIVVNAPKDVVSRHMFSFNNFSDWNPWYALDTNTKVEIKGDGSNGATYAWESEETGKGIMTATDISADQLKYSMKFIEPFESNADGYWKLEDAENGSTRVSWGFTTHAGYPMNGIMMIMGVTGSLRKDFDKGLTNLKNYVEARKNDAPAYKVEEISFDAHTYATIRKTMKTDDMNAMTQFFGSSYETLGKAAGPNINGLPSAIFYTWDMQKGITDVAPAFPVKPGTAIAGATMQDVPASKAYRIVYTGGYAGSGAAHEALAQHIAKAGEQQTFVIEEYVKTPGEEPDSNKWVTNIIYTVNKK